MIPPDAFDTAPGPGPGRLRQVRRSALGWPALRLRGLRAGGKTGNREGRGQVVRPSDIDRVRERLRGVVD